MLSLALVSYKGIPMESANLRASSVITTLRSGVSFLLPTENKISTYILLTLCLMIMTAPTINNQNLVIRICDVIKAKYYANI